MIESSSTFDKEKRMIKSNVVKVRSATKIKTDAIQIAGDRRRRSSNFHFKEIEDLLFQINSNKSIIECKRTDQLTNSCKDKTWKKIARIFNEGNTTKRSDKQLRSKWETLKKIARKEYASGNVSAISNNVLKIMMSHNDTKNFPDITCSQTLRLKEEPYFDCSTDQNFTSNIEDHNNQPEELKIYQMGREKGSTTSGSVIASSGCSERRMINTTAQASEPSPDNTEIQESTIDCLTKCTQYDPKDFGLVHVGRRPRYVNTHLQNLRRVFLNEENKRKREKHKIEIEILNTELLLKKRQLEVQNNSC